MKGAEEGSKPSFLNDSAAGHYRNGRHEDSCMAVGPGEWRCRKGGWWSIRDITVTNEMNQGWTCKEDLPQKTPLFHRSQDKGNPQVITEILEDLCHSLRDRQILESHNGCYFWLAGP